MWKKEKLLVSSNFSFFHSVFYPFEKPSAIFINLKIVVCKLFEFGSLKFVVWERVNSCRAAGPYIVFLQMNQAPFSQSITKMYVAEIKDNQTEISIVDTCRYMYFHEREAENPNCCRSNLYQTTKSRNSPN